MCLEVAIFQNTFNNQAAVANIGDDRSTHEPLDVSDGYENPLESHLDDQEVTRQIQHSEGALDLSTNKDILDSEENLIGSQCINDNSEEETMRRFARTAKYQGRQNRGRRGNRGSPYSQGQDAQRQRQRQHEDNSWNNFQQNDFQTYPRVEEQSFEHMSKRGRGMKRRFESSIIKQQDDLQHQNNPEGTSKEKQAKGYYTKKHLEEATNDFNPDDNIFNNKTYTDILTEELQQCSNLALKPIVGLGQPITGVGITATPGVINHRREFYEEGGMKRKVHVYDLGTKEVPTMDTHTTKHFIPIMNLPGINWKLPGERHIWKAVRKACSKIDRAASKGLEVGRILIFLLIIALTMSLIQNVRADDSISLPIFQTGISHVKLDNLDITRKGNVIQIDLPLIEYRTNSIRNTYSIDSWNTKENMLIKFLKEKALPLTKRFVTDATGKRWLLSKTRKNVYVSNFGLLTNSKCREQLETTNSRLPKYPDDTFEVLEVVQMNGNISQNLFVNPTKTGEKLRCAEIMSNTTAWPKAIKFRQNSCIINFGVIGHDPMLYKNVDFPFCTSTGDTPYWQHTLDNHCIHFKKFSEIREIDPTMITGSQFCECYIPKVTIQSPNKDLTCTVQPLTLPLTHRETSESNDVHLLVTIAWRGGQISLDSCMMLFGYHSAW